LKENQLDLFEDTKLSFKLKLTDSFSDEWEYSSARFETRKCSVIAAKDVYIPLKIYQL